MPRLHKSSWVVAALTLVVCALIIVPGQMTRSIRSSIRDFSHGWPAVFLDRHVDDSPPVAFDVADFSNLVFTKRDFDPLPQGPPWLSWASWQLWHTSQNKWNLLNLAFDILVAAAIVLVPTALWEFRRRRRGNLFQLRLSDFFVAITALALFLTWLMHHWKGYAEFSEIDSMQSDTNDDIMLFNSVDLSPKWLGRLAGPGNVPDCFSRMNEVAIYLNANNADRIERHLPRLERFSYLQAVYIACDSEPLTLRLRDAIRAVLPDCKIEMPDFQQPPSVPQSLDDEGVEDPFN